MLNRRLVEEYSIDRMALRPKDKEEGGSHSQHHLSTYHGAAWAATYLAVWLSSVTTPKATAE